MIKTVKGWKDIYGKDIKLFQYSKRVLSETAEQYGYIEMVTPIIEYTELFQRSVGQDTDIVEKEMYTFEDKSRRSLTLRPEITASIARSYVEHHFETIPSPLRLYYIGPCFRYEKPQKGRYREFYQFGVEAIGDISPLLDAEVVSLAVTIAKRFSLKEIKVKLNSIGCKKCRPLYKNALKNALKPHYDKLCDNCKKRFYTNPLRILDCKKENDELKKSLPKIADYLCEECKEHFDAVKKHLTLMNIPFELDSSLVRGLDYYTKTVFEVVSTNLGAQNALLGGGRYDYLIEELGGRHVPAVGFAMGIERLVTILEAEGKTVEEQPTIYIAYQENALKEAMDIANILRDNSFIVLMDIKGGNFKKQLERSAKKHSFYTIIIGEEEKEKRVLQVKNMETKEQKEIPSDQIITFLKNHTNGEKNA